MASLASIISLLFRYIIVKRRFLFCFLFISLPVYFLNDEDNIIRFLILNAFTFNLIILYSLSFIDHRLKKDGFYKLFDIHPIRVFISKFIILGSILFIHLALILTVTFKATAKTDISIFSSIIAFAISKILALRTENVYLSLIIFVLQVLLIAFFFLMPFRQSALLLFCALAIILCSSGYYQIKIKSYE